MSKIKFPSWEEFSAENDKALKQRKYGGYEVQIPVVHNLYLLLDCQNESCLWPNADNVIRFAWCTQNGFAIYSEKYEYSEAGYISGCAAMVKAAWEFEKAFHSVVQDTAHDIRERMDKYNEEYDNDSSQIGGNDERQE